MGRRKKIDGVTQIEANEVIAPAVSADNQSVVETPSAPKKEVKKIPTIRDYQNNKLFRCKNCSDTDGDVWVSWKEAIKVDPKSERTLLLCPYCKNQFGVFSLNNPIDPNFQPKNIKQGVIGS